MADRIIKVNAYTTFTLLDGEAEGHGWTEDALAVLNVTADDGDVLVELELDNTDTERVPAHAERATLSPDEARELAGELEAYAERAESDE
ncbi:DUF6360 family protein [Halobacterium sp. R2-5]|uniref:DUF6360 family protein n=1 Tax=Halobacterium sp. R2-5 TaxID=2715751 RepID=UPI001424834D|nr:DUF6360 family protein [Halobacterium sp. R2-5]NIB98315.1 hypothetical protein [Halobacterium sp. R2-5]